MNPFIISPWQSGEKHYPRNERFISRLFIFLTKAAEAFQCNFHGAVQQPAKQVNIRQWRPQSAFFLFCEILNEQLHWMCGHISGKIILKCLILWDICCYIITGQCNVERLHAYITSVQPWDADLPMYRMYHVLFHGLCVYHTSQCLSTQSEDTGWEKPERTTEHHTQHKQILTLVTLMQPFNRDSVVFIIFGNNIMIYYVYRYVFLTFKF